jgi:hypothetical protein
MKYMLAFKNHAISAVFAGLIVVTATSMSHAQTGIAAPAGSAEKQTPSGWKKAEPNRGGWLSAIFGSSAEPVAPEQAGSAEPVAPNQAAAGWSSAREGTGSCRHSSREEEDFVCKLIRIFWGPDRPPGPNRDLDIAAGGAAG